MRRRLRTFIVVAVVLPLIVSDVVWAFALGALADDSHHVALRSFPGEVDLVLQHGARHSADDHDHDHHARGDRESDVSSLHADDAYPGSHHRDHVVHLARPDGWSTGAQRSLPTIALIAVSTAAISPPLQTGTNSRVVGRLVGPDPSPPPRLTILRI